MHDFGPVCYLDPQKTGSSFVSAFLRRHLALQEVGFDKHARINQPAQMEPLGKLFFTSLRDPIRQYQSLYAFGVRYPDTPLRQRLMRVCANIDTVYDGSAAGFATWMDVVCDAERAPDLARGYTPELSGLIGLQSFRFLCLSFYRPQRILQAAKSRDDVIAAYNAHRLHRYILRTEALNDDLAGLIRAALWPYVKDASAALAELAEDSRRINAAPKEAGNIAPPAGFADRAIDETRGRGHRPADFTQ